ncbi:MULTISPECIES: DUF4861 family protein [unclassified Sphingopyxis]|uniref:DUF4861 family protein n=1 Tax=unclassified Sphingopyxis TaxID=2614943 RepID=UPI0007378AFF|nr:MULTISPECIES: DUF4861 family protein [unclassified Sphingopyxis]KTE43580.1 glycosyl hydrolase family 88 [Sphingopyxis sp. HIX]KTE85336.1 glycosyl hydrolase family 88 [Sphingopyxis sp. HXXIV]
MRATLLGLLLLGSAAAAQEKTPLRPATAEEQKARAAVAIADYRYGDLLWENDRIAFRIYARALEKAEPPSSSGIDAWGKAVRWPFMDRQLRTGDQHADHGEGIDFYNVGTGRGTGGLGIWYDNKLWTSRNYVRPQILNAGPDIADFSVDYEPWPVDTLRTVRETRRFTLPAGTNFTRLASTIASSSAEELIVGIGISKRPINGAKLGEIAKDEAGARMSWWGPADGDKGHMAAAVMVDPASFAGFAEDADNYLILVRVDPGKPFVYYSGAAWDRGGDFATRDSWTAHVAAQRPDFRP